MKLHLGCGEKYLEGYVNIDFPDSEQTVIKTKADEIADIRTLSYPDGTIDEVRSHHLFEHFTRAEALKLIARWRGWLKPGGTLVIETPDFTTSAALFLRTTSVKRRFELARHIYGSQEAGWADHRDYWDKQKFAFVLAAFGFKNIKIRRYWNGLSRHGEKIPKIGGLIAKLPEGMTVPVLNVAGNLMPESFYQRFGSNKMPNILVSAVKDGGKKIDDVAAARGILALSLVGREGEKMLDVWVENYKKF